MELSDWVESGSWESVSSTNLAAIQYDLRGKTLHVRFNSGSVYAYYNVPPLVAQELYDADSKGTFLADRIKHSFGYRLIHK